MRPSPVTPHSFFDGELLLAKQEPSQPRRGDLKLPVIMGAAARNADDADAELDGGEGEGAPSSSALPPSSGRARTASASRAGDYSLFATSIPDMNSVSHFGQELSDCLPGILRDKCMQCIACFSCSDALSHPLGIQDQLEVEAAGGRPHWVKPSLGARGPFHRCAFL